MSRLPRWLRWLAYGLGGLAVTALAVYWFYWRPAQRDYTALIKRLQSPTLSYQGTFTLLGQSFLSALDSNLNFNGHVDHPANTTLMNFNGTWAGQVYDGSLVTSGNEAYFKIKGQVQPVIRYKQSTFLIPLSTGWYRLRLDQSAFSALCQNSRRVTPGADLELYRVIRTTPLHSSWLVNFWSRFEGQPAVHFSGSVSGHDLPRLFGALADALPDGCDLNTLGFNPSDTANFKVHYDVWAADSEDHWQLTVEDKVLGMALKLVLVTNAYGQPVQIAPPASSVDLNQIFATAKPVY